MGQTCQDDTRTELSRPGEPGLTTRIVEKGIQQQLPPTAVPLTERVSDDSTFNANGIGNKLRELGVVLERNKVNIAQ